jgi:hypothetical protein
MELGSGTAACPSPSSWSSWWWWPAQQLVAAGDREPYWAVIFFIVFCNLCRASFLAHGEFFNAFQNSLPCVELGTRQRHCRACHVKAHGKGSLPYKKVSCGPCCAFLRKTHGKGFVVCFFAVCPNTRQRLYFP